MVRNHSKLGYETRSWPAALVMLASDLPLCRHSPLVWRNDVVLSCLGGLGDLMVQLPLLAALENKVRGYGGRVRVALRPGQAEIGEKLGWEVIRWENPLLVAIKKGMSGDLLRQTIRQIGALRREKPELWIDLTGHVVTAAMLKLGGVRYLAAKASAGGRSLIDHLLPHRADENAYETPGNWARFLGVELDRGVYARLVPAAARGEAIVLAISAFRWREWPLEYFLALARKRADLRFVLVGQRGELRAEELPLLDELARRPNVESRVDQLTPLELIARIAHARAIVTPDGGPHHIANVYGTPGVVIFGPEPEELWSPGPAGLRVLHDTACPHYPCHYQAGCRRPADWCMKKITPERVEAALAEVVGAVN